MTWICPYHSGNFPSKKEKNGFLSEDHFQIEANKWVWTGYPSLRRTFLHPANEGEKNIVKANRDFSKGMIPGAFDFIFMLPSFAVELKQPGNWLTENQEKFQKALRSNNIPEFVCYYMEEFQACVSEQLQKIGLTWQEPEMFGK